MSVSKPKIIRLVVGLLILSTLMVYFFSRSRALFEQNRLPLPFGFRYCLPQEEGQPCKRIQNVSPDAVRELLGTRRHGGPLILDSLVYSPAERSVKAFLSGNGERELVVNGVRAARAPRPTFALRLNRGYNEITLRYQPPADEVPKLTLSISEEIPFYRFIVPEKPLSRPLSRVLSALDRWKMAIFVLTFIVLMFRIGMVFFPIEAGPPATGAQGVFYGLLRGFSFFLVFGPLAYYLNHALRLGVPDLLLLLGGIVGSLGFFLTSLFRKPRADHPDGRPWVVLALITALIFLQVLLVSGSFLPPLVMNSDLPNHMSMMRSYQDSGDIFRSEHFSIYPQGLHMFLAGTTRLLGLRLQSSLLVYLILVLIGIYFVLYLLSQELSGRIHYAYFFLALSLTHFRFTYKGFFQTFSFPSLVAILFFLLALYFILKKDFGLSSISLAGAIITYPYYAAFFIWVILFAAVEWLKEPSRTAWQKVRRPLLYFLIPLFTALVYFRIYTAYGFSQHRQGFKAWFKIDPFISMQIINALLLLGGLYFLLKSGKDRRALRIVLGIVTGFLAYYIPYNFFSWSSTYYFMKNIQYVILLAIPLEMVALARLFRKLEDKAWAKYAILPGAAGIYVLRILGSIRI